MHVIIWTTLSFSTTMFSDLRRGVVTSCLAGLLLLTAAARMNILKSNTFYLVFSSILPRVSRGSSVIVICLEFLRDMRFIFIYCIISILEPTKILAFLKSNFATFNRDGRILAMDDNGTIWLWGVAK